MNSFSERFFKTVDRHFVSLSCVLRLPGKDEEKILVFSGFLVEAGAVWFYVTAGHILRDIRASLTVAYDRETIITGRTVLMPLERAEEPELAGRKAEKKFYARLKNVGDIKDIDGMSGGPVFALKKVEGKWEYRVIGVQSSWYPTTRTIAACPFSSLGVALEELANPPRH